MENGREVAWKTRVRVPLGKNPLRQVESHLRISQAAPEAVPSPFIVGVRVSPEFLCPRAPRGTPERDPPTLSMTGLNCSFPFLRSLGDPAFAPQEHGPR